MAINLNCFDCIIASLFLMKLIIALILSVISVPMNVGIKRVLLDNVDRQVVTNTIGAFPDNADREIVSERATKRQKDNNDKKRLVAAEALLGLQFPEPDSKSANFKSPTFMKNKMNNPPFQMDRGITTVRDIYQEYTVGLNGKPSVLTMDKIYGSIGEAIKTKQICTKVGPVFTRQYYS